jgi:hypothetical protein
MAFTGIGGEGGFGGFGGIPGIGAGGGLNLDVGGGFGLPGLGALGGGGGLPGWAGWNGPYIPSTPLGALGGIKGDLIIPIVAIGVALFILILIVLAVKYALAWKLSLLEDLAGPKKWRRDMGTGPAPHLDDNRMMELARVAMSAIYSESCTKRMLCEIGTYARDTKELPALLRVMEPVVPTDYVASVELIRSSAEGSFECAKQFPCGDGRDQKVQTQDQPGITTPTGQQQQPQPPQQTPRPTLLQGIQINASDTNEIRPKVNAPRKIGKFRRGLL